MESSIDIKRIKRDKTDRRSLKFGPYITSLRRNNIVGVWFCGYRSDKKTEIMTICAFGNDIRTDFQALVHSSNDQQ